MRALSAVAVVVLVASCLELAVCSPTGSEQYPLLPVEAEKKSRPEPEVRRKLHGKFLHISDIHPDLFYKPDSDIDERCHRGHGHAGAWGAETSSCDSPFSLVNETFRWIKNNLRDEIDFVVWTGDSARHDGDPKIPRSANEIYDLNQRISDKMVEVFGKDDNLGDDDPTNDLVVPIIPNMGNNDIFPHNIMEAGPSKLTRQYLKIWEPFIPEDQYHVFQRGAYWWTQVVPGTSGKMGVGEGGLAVMSLNTMYFFGSNTAVDGCDAPSEPGYEQMEWLRIQLQVMRDRKMKAILIGHVPPAWTAAKESWDESCWKKYVLWSKLYRDVIVGSAYGHMNLDHFLLLDGDRLEPPVRKKRRTKRRAKLSNIPALPWTRVVNAAIQYFNPEEPTCAVAEFNPEDDPVLSVTSAENYLDSLRETFSHIFSPSSETDSWDPPSQEDAQKRIGGKYAERYVLSQISPSVIPNYFPTLRVFEYNITNLVDAGGFVETVPATEDDGDVNEQRKRKDKDKSKKKPKPPVLVIPDPPDPTAPPGPAYSNQAYTWLGYTQYFANLTRYNVKARKQDTESGDSQDLELRKRAPSTNNDHIEYEVEYNTRADKVYKLKDLTVRSYIKLARKIVDASAPTLLDDEEDEEDLDDDDDMELDISKSWRKKCKKRKYKDNKKCKERKKKHKNKKRDMVWHTFVKRAFVSTISGDELDEFDTRRQHASTSCAK